MDKTGLLGGGAGTLRTIVFRPLGCWGPEYIGKARLTAYTETVFRATELTWSFQGEGDLVKMWPWWKRTVYYLVAKRLRGE